MDYRVDLLEFFNNGKKIEFPKDAIKVEVNMIAEGIVWRLQNDKVGVVRFKCKGSLHAGKSKVKVLVPIDAEKLNSIADFVDYAVTEERLKQGVERVFAQNNEEPDIKKLGNFLKWIFSDVCKEELDVMVKSNLQPGDISKQISNKTRTWFIEKYVEMK